MTGADQAPETARPGQPGDAYLSDEWEPTRPAFERYFAWSRKSKGAAKRPTFERLGDGTYADDPTQRHWWTWQQALAAAASR
jgi:hypothetical protein